MSGRAGRGGRDDADGQQKQHKDSREFLEQRLDLPRKSFLFPRLCLFLVVMTTIVLRLMETVMGGECVTG